MAGDLRDGVEGNGGWPLPGSAPLDRAGARPWVAGDQLLPFKSPLQCVLSQPGHAQAALLLHRHQRPTPWCTHSPPPSRRAPPRAEPRAGRGRSSEPRVYLQPSRSLGSQAVFRSLFHISTPLPSTGTSSHQLTPSTQLHCCSCTDMLACGSGKGRAKSLPGNDVICSVHCTWLQASLPHPTPSPPCSHSLSFV